MSLLLNMLSSLVITFLPRSKRLLISWLQSPSTVIMEPRKIKTLFPLFPHLFPMKWWDWIPWSSFSECWALNQLFHSPPTDLNIIYYDVNMFFSYKYLKLRHHKHGTETLKKKSSFLIKSFFLTLILFKIHFWLCQVFTVLASSSFCSNRAMNSPEKLSRGMVGDWHFDASFGQSRGLSLFFFLAVLSLFLLHVGFL